MDNRPIGIFDSGVGGLTVLKEIEKLLPNENLIYFGDCGRAPYGTKSEENVKKYAAQDTRFLLNSNIKILVIACNTMSAIALKEIAETAGDIAVLDVIASGVNCVTADAANKRVGVIATVATISSKVYETKITNQANVLGNKIDVYAKACPLFVPIVEEGWWDSEIAGLTAKEYLDSLLGSDIDTLLLGCTHYPLLEDTIRLTIGENIRIINSAKEVALAVRNKLSEDNMLRKNQEAGTHIYYTSDSVEKFKELGEIILSIKMNEVNKVDIEQY
jgi:glutamate racemase